jgi:hypothetical protein
MGLLFDSGMEPMFKSMAGLVNDFSIGPKNGERDVEVGRF